MTDPDLCLGVARSNGAYSVNSRYNALHISSRLPKLIDVLVEEGFLEFSQGSFHRDTTAGQNRTSRIKPTPRLLSIFSEFGLESYELDLHHKQECIILTKDEPNEDNDSIRTKVEYEDTPQTIEMRQRLQSYNDFLAATYIDIPSLTDPWITRQKGQGEAQRIPIGQTNKFVRRIFSRGSWCLNGRFYGGWWQQIGKDLRKQITINNEPTVEVDYKGMHVAILSALSDAPPTRGKDRYTLKQQVLPNFSIVEQRTIVKFLVLTAINARDEKSAYRAFRSDQPTGSREKKLKDTELSLFLESFIEENPHLRDDMCSDKGIQLMYLDSQITDRIISSFLDQQRPILTVHDSYIVSTFHVDELSRTMSQASKSVVGKDLDFEQDAPGYSDVIRMRGVDRDRYLSTFRDVFATKDRTPQYQDRLRRFINYRKNTFPDTYWLM